LTALDRDRISQGLVAGWSQSRIAREIGRHRSVVHRELERHTSDDGVYYASVAHAKAYASTRRPKPFKLAQNPELCEQIEAWMDDGWSPHLIASVLAADAGDDHTGRVSHETIYQALYVQARGQLRADLHRQLSTGRAKRVPRTAATRRSPYVGALTITQRPAEADDRAVPGHWEADLILGAGNRSAIGTLVERASRFTLLLHLPGGRHTAEVMATAMIDTMSQLPAHLRRSLAYDRGTEMAEYLRIQLELQMPVYFCDPHAPWQRGSNENTNRLLRHWFEKGTDLADWTPERLTVVQDKLNARPRPTLDLRTPAQAFNEYLQQQAA
jgi:IS30 family transposase